MAEVLRIEIPIRKRSMSLDESRLIVLAKEGDANAFAALLREGGEKGTAPLADAPVVQVSPLTAALGEENPAADYASQFEELSRSQLRLLLKRLDRKKDLSDAELERKYPTVESIAYPSGTQVFLHLEDSNTDVVWILPHTLL